MLYRFWILCVLCSSFSVSLEARQTFHADPQEGIEQTALAKTGEPAIEVEDPEAVPSATDVSGDEKTDEIENTFVLVGSAETSERQSDAGNVYATLGLAPSATLSASALEKVKRLDAQKKEKLAQDKKKLTLLDVSAPSQGPKDPRQEIIQKIQEAKRSIPQ